MANQKHLTLDERVIISTLLDKTYSFKAIANEIDKDCTTISKEVRHHIVFKRIGCQGNAYNACRHRYTCDHRLLCTPCHYSHRPSFCRRCKLCNAMCPDFELQLCPQHAKPPYVCNGCEKLNKCTLEKRFYHAEPAHCEYQAVLSEARQGISLTEHEVKHLDSIISPLIKKGQSLNHICANNKDSLMVSKSTLYRLIDFNVFSARNIDMPRKVRYAKRKIKKQFKVDKACRIGRTYRDFQHFLDENPHLPIVEMDTVEGRKGGKVLLTLHFVKAEFMLAFLRQNNDSQSVITIIENLYLKLGQDIFIKVMPLLLADNGSEFSNPKALEFDQKQNRRTHLFYCDPSSPGQKGSAERNHELIRYFIPKGTSMDGFNQADISHMMDNINSYCRPSLGNKCPYDMLAFLYGKELLEALGCHKIPPNEVIMNPSLFKENAGSHTGNPLVYDNEPGQKINLAAYQAIEEQQKEMTVVN
jgi:IS30 family transposase